MIDVILAEHHDLLPIFHKSLRILMHAVHKRLVIEVFLHLGDIDNAAVGQFLELVIVDVGAVHCRDLITLVMAWSEHERIVCRRRCELYIAWHTFIGVYHCMDFNAAFLFACLRMATNALENGIGEQAYGCGIDDAQPFYPFFRAVTPAVR